MLLSPEYRLVTACASWPPSETRSVIIRDAIARPIDWDRVFAIVRRHRVMGQAHQGLTEVISDAAPIPVDVRARLGNDALAVARVNLQMQAETGRLQRLFGAASLPVLFLKGVPLAMVAYGNVAIRHSKDIDVLVAPDHVATTAAVLEAQGYQRVAGPPDFSGGRWGVWRNEFHHVSYLHPRTRIEVELHWRLFRNTRFVPLLQRDAEYGSVRLPDGTEVLTLSNADAFVYLCAHGAQHNWFRLKWLADVAALLSQQCEPDIERLYESARNRGAGLFAAQAMLLANQVLNSRLPLSLLSRLRAVSGISRLEQGALRALFGPGFQAEPSEWRWRVKAEYEWHALRLGGPRYRAAQVRMLLISQHDVRTLRLPRRAAFLYPVIRGPRWVWQKIGRIWRPA